MLQWREGGKLWTSKVLASTLAEIPQPSSPAYHHPLPQAGSIPNPCWLCFAPRSGWGCSAGSDQGMRSRQEFWGWCGASCAPEHTALILGVPAMESHCCHPFVSHPGDTSLSQGQQSWDRSSSGDVHPKQPCSGGAPRGSSKDRGLRRGLLRWGWNREVVNTGANQEREGS